MSSSLSWLNVRLIGEGMMFVCRTLLCASHSGAAPSSSARRVVKMHGLPRGWMHDEVVKLIDVVAARINAPVPPDDVSGGSEESALANSSPFVRRVRIPFGRKTGVLYGDPVVEVTSSHVADALLSLTFDEYSDARRRLHFTEVDLQEYDAKRDFAKSRAAREEQEDAQALATLDLDRFLLDPDLLYDMKKRRQRRRLTVRDSIDVPSFRNDVTKPTVGEQGDLNTIGRGNHQNLDIPMPYVQGRRGF